MTSQVNQGNSARYIHSLYLNLLVGDGSNIDAIKKRCEKISHNPDAKKFGLTQHFNIKEIDQYLSTTNLPKNYRIIATKDGLKSWDKLCLAADRFVSNFFDDMKIAKGEYKEPFLKIIEEIKKYGLPDCDLETEAGQDTFKNLLEQVLASRIHLFVRNDPKHKAVALMALFNCEQDSCCRIMFGNLISDTSQNILSYIRSPRRKVISELYTYSSQVPNMQKINPFFDLLENFGREQLHLSDTGIEVINAFIGTTNICQGVPKFIKTTQFLTGISDFLAKEFPDSVPDDYIKVLKAIGTIYFGKKVPDLDSSIQFLKVIINFCDTELNDRKYFYDVADIVASILHGKETSELETTMQHLKVISDFCKTDLKTSDPKDFFALANPICSIISNKEMSKPGKTKKILSLIKDFCITELKTEDLENIVKFANVFNIMKCGQRMSEFKSVLHSIKVMVNFCKMELKISDPEDLIRMASILAVFNSGKGMINFQSAKEFFREANKLCKEKYNITEAKPFLKAIRSITGKFCSKGFPAIEDVESELDKSLKA